MMNRKSVSGLMPSSAAKIRAYSVISGIAFMPPPLGPLNAQFTLDGTNCVVFADMFDGELARCVTRRKDGSTLKISLIGKRPNSVSKIELSINGLAPFQTVEVSAEPIITQQNIGLLITDMNFDELPDFAVMEFASAGPNTPYLYFLFNTESGKFESSAALSQITSPVFDTHTSTITSHWREGAGKSGRDSYVWRDSKPVLVERLERTHDGTGCRSRTYGEKDGKLELLKSTECAD